MMIKNDFDPNCITYSQMNLIFNARIYYRRLITWTRAYLLSKYFGIGTAEELFGRLYLESIDIGNMLQMTFGRISSDRYSQMLSQFAIDLRNVIEAQLAGNTEAVRQNVDALYQNVTDRAAFLEAMNPYWSKDIYQQLFNTYIQDVLEQANALATKDFSKDIEIFDRLSEHANRMGDVFAQGLYDYITSGEEFSQNAPRRQDQQCVTLEQMNEIFGIRMFWFELVTWTRNYIISRYKGIGDSNAVYARLNQVLTEYMNVLKQVFGANATADLQRELNTYIQLIDDFITAQMENNSDELDRVTRLLYQNANEIAASLAALNPYWDEAEWRSRLYENLRSTIDETTSFLSGDYARNIDIFSTLLDQAESAGEYFTQGLFQYINKPPMPQNII